jgi:pimeloyl-ACP methyl ester carboxylesterase
VTGFAHAVSLGGIPALVAVPAGESEPYRTVLWFHGFRADALAHAAELERCAAMGFLAVGIDAVGHGARAHHDIAARISRGVGGALPVMLELAEATIAELPSLVDELVTAYGADRGRISAVGISMGAFLLYRSIVVGPPLRAAVALLGSPEWDGNDSPHLALDAFERVALLSITAEYDESVPPAPAERLHADLANRFGDRVVQRHVELRGSGHLTSAAHWEEAMRETLEWLQRFG